MSAAVEIIEVNGEDVAVYEVLRSGAVSRWARGLDGKLYRWTRARDASGTVTWFWRWQETDRKPPSGLTKRLDFEILRRREAQ